MLPFARLCTSLVHAICSLHCHLRVVPCIACSLSSCCKYILIYPNIFVVWCLFVFHLCVSASMSTNKRSQNFSKRLVPRNYWLLDNWTCSNIHNGNFIIHYLPFSIIISNCYLLFTYSYSASGLIMRIDIFAINVAIYIFSKHRMAIFSKWYCVNRPVRYASCWFLPFICNNGQENWPKWCRSFQNYFPVW